MFPDFEHGEPDSLQLLVQILEKEEPTFHYAYVIKQISPDRENRGSGRVSVETWVGFDADDKNNKIKWVRVGSRASSEARDLSSFYAISVMADDLQKNAERMQKFVTLQMTVLDVVSGGITSAGKAVLKEAVKETVEKLAKDAVKRKILKKELAKRITKQALAGIGELTQLLSSVTAKATAAFLTAFGKDLIQRYGWEHLRKAAQSNGTPTSNVPAGVDSTYFEFTSSEIEVTPSIEKGVLAATQVIISDLASEAFKKKIKADLKLRRAIQQAFGEDTFIDELNGAFELKFKQFLLKTMITDNINTFIDSVGKAAQSTKTNAEGQFLSNLTKEIGSNLRSRILNVFKESLSALSELS